MRLLISIVCVFICLVNSSCQKELSSGTGDTTITPPQGVSGSFTAKIDGVQFTGDKATGATRALNVIAITGLSQNGQMIFLRVADSGVHQYTLDINSLTNASAFSVGSDVAFSSNGGSTSAESGGTLSITSINTVNQTMSGTFSFKAYRQTDQTQKTLTEGVFKDVSYASTIPPASGTDSFRVKINAVPLSVFSILPANAFGQLHISGSDQNLVKVVSITVPGDVTVGTYAFLPFAFDYMGQYNNGTSYQVSQSGSVTILEHNTSTKRIRGNFTFNSKEFTGTDSSKLTEGYFSVKYQ